MSDDQPERPAEADAELQREIRAERKFTLAEAIGRLAGPGMMKGVSPVSPQEQAVARIQDYLNRNLSDREGALSGVLLRQVSGSESLLHDFDRPLVVLADYVRRVIDSEFLLKELVREADMEWGRIFGERPHFEREGSQPHADDPYTIESVRGALSELSKRLTSGEA